ADDLHPAGPCLLDRLGPDARDRRFAGTHHRQPCTLLGHQQKRQALELRRAAPVRGVTASYSMRSPGTLRTNFQGPLPTGLSRDPLAPTVSMYFFGMTEPSMKTARDRLATNCGMTPFVWTRTVRSSTTSIRSTARRRAAAPDEIDSGDMTRSRLNFTSCAVSGSPLWKRWPLRR